MNGIQRIVVLALGAVLLPVQFISGQVMAQSASRCVLYDGSFCWASVPGNPGEGCQCLTSQGWVSGTLQQ